MTEDQSQAMLRAQANGVKNDIIEALEHVKAAADLISPYLTGHGSSWQLELESMKKSLEHARTKGWNVVDGKTSLFLDKYAISLYASDEQCVGTFNNERELARFLKISERKAYYLIWRRTPDNMMASPILKNGMRLIVFQPN